MKKTWVGRTALVISLAALGGCAWFGKGNKIKAPSMQVAGVSYAGTGLTGAKLNVSFNVRNVNPTPLVVESFRYDLTLNGQALGSGYYPTRMELAPNSDRKVTSVFDLNYMKAPASLQSVLQQEHVTAHVVGKFFLAGGQTLGFKSQASVSMQK